MELQEAWNKLQHSDVAIFAISYDSVEVLAAFTEKRGITFPLLSDEGSHTIRALGLLNTHLVEQHAFHGVHTRDEQLGVAYPGTFVLDERGIISEKHFEQSYRVRPTAPIFEQWALGASEGAPSAEAPRATSANIELRAWTDSPTYRPYQQVRLHAELSLPADMHAFASPVPDGYTPLSFQVDPLDGLLVDDYAMRPPHPFTIEGLEEQFLVYEGTLRTMIPLRLTSNLGRTMLTLRANYQACTATVCFPPATLRVDVPMTDWTSFVTEQFEYISHAQLEYRHGYRHDREQFTATVDGRIVGFGRTIKIESIRLHYDLTADVEHQDVIERALRVHPEGCPAHQSVKGAIAVTWEATLRLGERIVHVDEALDGD